jgi:hypothetical protein
MKTRVIQNEPDDPTSDERPVDQTANERAAWRQDGLQERRHPEQGGSAPVPQAPVETPPAPEPTS